jgi:DNA replication and repair protein RecF
MLSIRNIIITHFKNYEITSFSFNHSVIGICGLNGVGKTNLLDAIYYCCFTKSYFTVSDALNIGFNKTGFRLEADFVNRKNDQKVVCIHRGQTKKEFYVNEVLYDKLSKHIGQFPAVMVAPDDVDIITGSSEMRRKYLDTNLCQLDAEYLRQLITYNKILQQRNSLLKNEAEKGSHDDALLEIIDDQLLVPGNYIFQQRNEFCEKLLPLIGQFYTQIASADEDVRIYYESNLIAESFHDVLKKNRQKDRILQRTNAGIHKDDLKLMLGEQLFKNTASQGQRKSLLFALKLAEYEMIKINKGFPPLLLLDDVFEKLDSQRMNNLLHWVCKENNGQVFITDTHRERLTTSFAELNIDGEILELK